MAKKNWNNILHFAANPIKSITVLNKRECKHIESFVALNMRQSSNTHKQTYTITHIGWLEECSMKYAVDSNWLRTIKAVNIYMKRLGLQLFSN